MFGRGTRTQNAAAAGVVLQTAPVLWRADAGASITALHVDANWILIATADSKGEPSVEITRVLDAPKTLPVLWCQGPIVLGRYPPTGAHVTPGRISKFSCFLVLLVGNITGPRRTSSFLISGHQHAIQKLFSFQ